MKRKEKKRKEKEREGGGGEESTIKCTEKSSLCFSTVTFEDR